MSMNFFPQSTSGSSTLDLRTELHAVIFGRVDLIPQGKQIILRRLSDQQCKACFSAASGGTTRPHCPYCDGEGYLWSETLETVFIAHGVAPIYKPGVFGTGQYPQSSYGYTDPNKASIYAEYTIYPNYERYTLQTNPAYDVAYELKVDATGNTIHPLKKVAKWKFLSVTPIFGDYGRVEYFEISVEKINV